MTEPTCAWLRGIRLELRPLEAQAEVMGSLACCASKANRAAVYV